jgi:amidase
MSLDFTMTAGSARPLADATRIAYRELVRWMVADYGFDQGDASMMLSFVDPTCSVGAAILKECLAR